MPDTKITALTALTAADPANDVLPIVDVSDTTMAASGTTKKISINNVLGASGTATLASATISGDLTVDTNTLKVDSANNRVGIGTASPARPLDIVGSFQSTLGWVLTGTPAGLGAATRYIGGASTTDSWYFNALTGGNHLWAFGESLAMTLNSTGLGVGYTPSGSADKLGSAATLGVVATGVTADLNFRNSSLTSIQRIRYTDGTGVLTIGSASTVSYQVELGGNTTTRAVTIDASSNVGIGVTPKSWASGYRALQLGVYSALTDAAGGATYLTNNAYFDSVDSRWEYITNNRVVRYDQDTADGGHKWYSAAAGAVNAAIAWGNPLMTLDTNGNLILQSPSTPPTLTTNGQLTVNATSNTNLRFSYRGSDGVTRVANITLA